MDTNAILSKLNRAAPGKVLESSRFGRSDTLAVWVEAKAVRSIGEALSNDLELELDWVENFSVAEIGEALVVTYFFRSRLKSTRLIIRTSLVPEFPEAAVELSTVRDLWPMVTPMENESSELFGIRFLSQSGELVAAAKSLLVNIEGYPLRKNFYPGGKK